MPTTVFSIGDIVEVFCDHKRGGRRVRDWVEGVVVHADDRMTAIQFRVDVYLTDGWMVPDRILWFNKGTEKIRILRKSRTTAPGRRIPARPLAKKAIPAKKRIVKPAPRHRVPTRK
jgi:hypothetical protein